MCVSHCHTEQGKEGLKCKQIDKKPIICIWLTHATSTACIVTGRVPNPLPPATATQCASALFPQCQ